MKQAYDYCVDVINSTKTIFENGIRKDLRLFDVDAFRESWYNACLHNDWIDGTPPAVYIFDDHLEIISTGGLPEGFTKQDFFSGISRPVNEVLARIFIQLGLIEQTGHGVLLIVDKYGKEVFEFLDNFIKVNIPFNVNATEEKVTEKVTERVTDKLNLVQRRIVEKIQTNPKITIPELMNELSLSDSGIRKNLTKLKELGIIKRIGSNKTGYWEIQ